MNVNANLANLLTMFTHKLPLVYCDTEIMAIHLLICTKQRYFWIFNK